MSQLDIWSRAPRAPQGTESPRAAWQVTARFATGVLVITTGTGNRAQGMTVSAFSMVSRTPPLVSVALQSRSRCLAQLKEEGTFGVSALAAGQGGLARHFADPARRAGPGQLSASRWLLGPAGGVPVLRGAVGWLDCQVELVIPAGDHELVIARVHAATPGHGLPLVQCAGELRDDLSPRRAAPAGHAARPHGDEGGQP